MDSFRYLGVNFNKSGDFQAIADAVFSSSFGKMWAVLAKIRSLCAIPSSFTLMLYIAVVQGSQSYASEVWLPLVRPRAADQAFTAFMQHFLHLHAKTSHPNIYVLTGKLPFSTWARQHAVAFLLRAVARGTLRHTPPPMRGPVAGIPWRGPPELGFGSHGMG